MGRIETAPSNRGQCSTSLQGDNKCMKDKAYWFKGNATPLPEGFVPGDIHFVCGRGSKNYTHSGNNKFRAIVFAKFLDAYREAASKAEKSCIIDEIVSQRLCSGGFVKKHPKNGMWYNVCEDMEREKTSQVLRDALHQQYRSSNIAKKRRRTEAQMPIGIEQNLKTAKTSSNCCEEQEHGNKKALIQVPEEIIRDDSISSALRCILSTESMNRKDDFELPEVSPNIPRTVSPPAELWNGNNFEIPMNPAIGLSNPIACERRGGSFGNFSAIAKTRLALGENAFASIPLKDNMPGPLRNTLREKAQTAYQSTGGLFDNLSAVEEGENPFEPVPFKDNTPDSLRNMLLEKAQTTGSKNFCSLTSNTTGVTPSEATEEEEDGRCNLEIHLSNPIACQSTGELFDNISAITTTDLVEDENPFEPIPLQRL